MQYDAFDIGFITTDDFTNADILEATYPALAKRLFGDWISDPAIPIVTGFLGKVSLPAICKSNLFEMVQVVIVFESELFSTYHKDVLYFVSLLIIGLEILCHYYFG